MIRPWPLAGLLLTLSIPPAAVVREAAAQPVPAAGQGTYVAGIDDLPLMPGLSAVPNAAVVFDKPSGRIVESYAEGAVARDAVVGFYDATLPQLGWRAMDSARGDELFVREGERLGLSFLGGDGELIVRFTLEPD